MTSTSDTGHAKNVANFEELISICTDYGTAYNPSNENLKIQKLQDKLEISGKNIQTVRFAKTVYDNACNAREIAFSGFKKLSTRIINAMEASNVAKQTINDAKTINRKIQGKRSNNSKKDTDAIITPDENTTPEDKTISVSQQSFDNLINNFSNMIEIVSAEPLYTPR